MEENKRGGWVLADTIQPGNLPEKVATAWSELMQNIAGAKYVPVLYVGTQLVNGTNHMILSRQDLSVLNGESHLVKVILNCALTGEWSILSIETII